MKYIKGSIAKLFEIPKYKPFIFKDTQNKENPKIDEYEAYKEGTDEGRIYV